MNNKGAEKIESLILRIIEKKLLNKGYMCGFVNGLRMARSIIEGNEEKVVLERNEIMRNSKKDVMIATDDKGRFLALIFNKGNLEKIEKL